jgi:16S rRNA (adenine1518-N6/adenine1519-N6)-dimethyltransferase
VRANGFSASVEYMGEKLGQHFLDNPQIIKRIVKSADIEIAETVLEIGPGTGFLTRQLETVAGHVLAIELDENLAENLSEEFERSSTVDIIHGDILTINLPELLKSYEIEDGAYSVVANIPYYITAKILRLFLELAIQPRRLTLLMQKDVAKRLVAKPGKLSILGVSVQYYAQTELLFDVPPDAFSPAPKVTSSVVRIEPHANRPPHTETLKFFRVVKSGFGARRKTLRNNFLASLHTPKEEIDAAFARLGLRPSVRAQELDIETWKKLAHTLT